MGLNLGSISPQHASSAEGLAAAFRSNDKASFEQMVSQLFLISDPQQRAGLLNQLLDDVSPAMLTALGGSIGELLTRNGHTRLTPEQAADITPPQVAEIAATAAQHDPGVVDRVAAYYADHPELIHTLGSAPQPTH